MNKHFKYIYLMDKVFAKYWYFFVIDFLLFFFVLALCIGMDTSYFQEWALKTYFTIGIKSYCVHDLWVYSIFTSLVFLIIWLFISVWSYCFNRIMRFYKGLVEDERNKISKKSNSVD